MSGEIAGFFIVVFIVALFVFCIYVCDCDDQSAPAYSAPIVVTSQTHQPPGSSPAITVSNVNSSSSGFAPRSSSPATQMPTHYSRPGFTTPGSQVNSNVPYPHPSHMPYPPQTMYPPQNVPGVSQGSNTPQPSAPYPTSPASQDMDVPPNYDEAMTIFSKEQKKF